MFTNPVFSSQLRAEMYLLSLPITGVFHQKQKQCWGGRGWVLSDLTLDFPSVLAEIEDVCIFLPGQFSSGSEDLLQSPTIASLLLQILQQWES